MRICTYEKPTPANVVGFLCLGWFKFKVYGHTSYHINWYPYYLQYQFKETNCNSVLCFYYRSYTNPVAPSDELLQEASWQFTLGVLSSLKSASFSPVYVNMRLDVWRYITYNKGTPSVHRRHWMLHKEDTHMLKFLPFYLIS